LKILWLTWKDRANPQAGGAELVAAELAQRLVKDGHELVFLTASFPKAKHREFHELPAEPPRRISALEAASSDPSTLNSQLSTKKGFWIIRVGGRVTVYWHAFKYFKKHLTDWPDVIIEEVNTVPFFSNFYPLFSKKPSTSTSTKTAHVRPARILFFHMLCRRIWFHEIFFPLSLVGYIIEPIYIRLLGHPPVITVSESSRQDLTKYGFKPGSTHLISEGIEVNPVEDLAKVDKFPEPTILSLGAIRSMKRTLEIVQAFELAKKQLPNLKLKLVGEPYGSYGKRVLGYVGNSPYRADIEVLGRVELQDKINIMRQSHLILVTSIKEGWGLIVTEAASQGTPAVVYNVDGLRDSVRHDKTGVVCQTNNPETLSQETVNLLKDQKRYEKLQRAAWDWSKEITFDQSYRDFKEILGPATAEEATASAQLDDSESQATVDSPNPPELTMNEA